MKDDVTNRTAGPEVESLYACPLQPGRDDPLANPFGQKRSSGRTPISAKRSQQPGVAGNGSRDPCVGFVPSLGKMQDGNPADRSCSGDRNARGYLLSDWATMHFLGEGPRQTLQSTALWTGSKCQRLREQTPTEKVRRNRMTLTERCK